MKMEDTSTSKLVQHNLSENEINMLNKYSPTKLVLQHLTNELTTATNAYTTVLLQQLY